MKPHHNTPRKYVLTEFRTKTNAGKLRHDDADGLARLFRSPPVYVRKDVCPLTRLGMFEGNSRASGSALLTLDALQVDYDAGVVTVAEAAAALRAAGIFAMIYTSANHLVLDPPKYNGGPRWRVVAPLAAPITEPQHAALVSLLNGALGGVLAPESWQWSRCYYIGRVKGVAYEFEQVDGEPIDVVALCPDFEPIAPAELTKATRTIDRTGIVRDDPVVEHLRLRGELLGGNEKGAFVRCPKAEQHTTDTGPSSSIWMYATASEPAHFVCRHTSHGPIVDTEFLRMVDFDRPVEDFEVITPDAAQQAEDAIVRARNTKKAAEAMPGVVAETKREREARVERERSATIGQGATPLPTQRLMSASEMLEDLVFLEEGSRVSRVSDPRYVLPFMEFKQATAASTSFARNGAGRSVKVHNAQLWLESTDRKTVRTQTFAPGRAALCMSPNHVPAQNLWAPRRDVVPANWRELVAPFFDHVAYLVPVAAERERFLDWVAHIEQAPGTLPSTHYLMVAGQTGIGRNWLAYALARAFAGHTALGFDLGAALKSGFNGSLSMKLLAVVDELHEGGPGGAHTPAAEKLKSMLTETTRLINPKHGRQHTEFNCSRFLMFSNHAAALPLADNDRRVIVIENPSERRSEDYFVRLYALLEEPGLGPALAEAFRCRDLSGFNPGAPAPMTEAKARTVRAGRSEIEQAVRDVAAEWASDCITSSRLSLVVAEALGGKSWSTQNACVAAGLTKYRGRVKVGGVASHVWILRDAAGWADAAPFAIAKEALRGQQIEDYSEFA